MRQCLDVRVYTGRTSVLLVYVSRHLRPAELLTGCAVKETRGSSQHHILKNKKTKLVKVMKTKLKQKNKPEAHSDSGGEDRIKTLK